MALSRVCATPFSGFFLNDSATTEIYTSRHTLSLHDALPISRSTLTLPKCRHDGKLRPHDWHKHQLRDAIAGVDGKGGRAAVPATDHQRALIVGVDQIGRAHV